MLAAVGEWIEGRVDTARLWESGRVGGDWGERGGE